MCRTCGADVSTTGVPVRPHQKDEDLKNYRFHCARRCAEHHREHSPGCPTDEFDLRLPAENVRAKRKEQDDGFQA